MLVGQWRHAWSEQSWEVPAGTLEEGEEPLHCAKRELAEEAGMQAAAWESLGTARGTAATTLRYHLYLARELTRVDRAPEGYEQDMVLREVSLAEAIEEAMTGRIQHAVTVTALARAARRLGAI